MPSSSIVRSGNMLEEELGGCYKKPGKTGVQERGRNNSISIIESI